MKSRLVVLAAAALIAWGLKRHYADARPDDLLWILSPTAWLVGVAAGATFVFQPGEGYLSREHLFLIEKSCAGINFMVAAFGMLVFALFHRVGSGLTAAAQVLGGSLLASYAAAVVVNAVRVVIAMWLAAHPFAVSTLGPADIHRLEGITVYFGGLVLLHELVRVFDPGSGRAGLSGPPSSTMTRIARAFRRTALPLASYYAVTLAASTRQWRGALGAAFVEHALVVLVVPPIIIVLACAARYSIGSSASFRGCRGCGLPTAASPLTVVSAPDRRRHLAPSHAKGDSDCRSSNSE